MPVLLVTAYFPSAAYVADAIGSDEVVIEAFETYTKQTCRNRCVIYGPNGKHRLTVPVIKANGNHTLTRDILVSANDSWQKIHWRSIQTAYNNSPFFLYYQDDFAPIFFKEYRFLLDLNMEILSIVLKLLKKNPHVRLTDNFEKFSSIARDHRATSAAGYLDKNMMSPNYTQVFEFRHGFIPGLSILDLIFNKGPESREYLDVLK